MTLINHLGVSGSWQQLKDVEQVFSNFCINIDISVLIQTTRRACQTISIME